MSELPLYVSEVDTGRAAGERTWNTHANQGQDLALA